MVNAINFENIQANAELNSLQKTVNVKSEGVEIFSAMCAGKDVSKYGNKVDKVNAYVKTRGVAAKNGDVKAQAELNAIRTEMIEAPLLKRLNILDFMGEKIDVGMNEAVEYKVYNLEGKMSDWQAVNGTFPFATYTYKTRTMDTDNITGGILIDHREFATGNLDAIQTLNEQTVTDMMNKVFYKVQKNLYAGIKGAPIKNFAEAAGITKTSVDAALKKARRFGNVTMIGDYSVITQIEDFAGFKVDTSGSVRFSEAVMEEIRKTGLLKTYKGTPIVEIPNSFNMTKLNDTKDFYETYLPEGLLYFLISGALSPLKIGFKGGLQTMAGQDLNLRADVMRFDLEMGTAVIDEYVPAIGLVSDSNYSVDK
ncbi:hypothetical protein [Congzhengia minquanensis]|uniref:Phage major capsid protein n=1 Tax=Congzhengia minquanensis TaxID=2763657 RepID=A0A926DP97_9FIRM|nr:hypothetical protein [Congzhengia minquanensis]MBC8540839.1 hypothetical protein [Congzhengia minquanensis]